MYLFGGKFCKFMDEELGERECTCPEIIAKHPLCECDRKHFNNFLWATVTVFQVSLVFRPLQFLHNLPPNPTILSPECEVVDFSRSNLSRPFPDHQHRMVNEFSDKVIFNEPMRLYLVLFALIDWENKESVQDVFA